MRVAVTGSNGRLGRALMAALREAVFSGPEGPIGWSRPEFDLDDISGAVRLLRRDQPDLVIHTAAWTDVDACAREPELAEQRNGLAVGQLARMCVAEGAGLILISTNEVFDGKRTDGRGYEPDDVTTPPNAYGRSKLSGEHQARAAYRLAAVGSRPSLAIVRTAWLFGPPGADFPSKIVAAAQRVTDGMLAVVGDEIGSPSYAQDVAAAIADLAQAGVTDSVHHVVNRGQASRADWAREVLRMAGLPVTVREVPGATWKRDSTPPRWAVLAPTPLPGGPLRDWHEALADERPRLRRAAHAGVATS